MADRIRTTCCITGGGPAGVMLGYLLARRGVPVTVLEKHKDFLRDFRGDTVHPSTLEVLYELDLLEQFLALPHQEVTQTSLIYGDSTFRLADFRFVPAHCRFVAFMPQWDFLNFLSGQARRFSGFQLRMEHEVFDLLQTGSKITGVKARGPKGEPVEIHADLVVGCDGRHSIVRKIAGLPVRDYGVPIDVLWFHIGRKEGDPGQLFGKVNYGKAMVLIDRGSYFQAGLIIRKGSFEELRRAGLESLRKSIARIAPFLSDRLEALRSWEQIKLLTVQINRLQRWHRPGLLCIGDAAHAMSPAGGVGINLAIQDAVAAANLLAGPLARGEVSDRSLAAVQCRREFPARATQALQVNAHKALEYVFRQSGRLTPPWQLKAAVRIPGIQLAIGYVVGIGFRPEHVQSARRRPSLLTRLAAVGVGVCTGVAVFAAQRKRVLPRPG